MKKILLLIVFICVSLTSVAAESQINKQWFIQVGAYTSLDNAIRAEKDYKDKLVALSLYIEEREFDNYVTIHKQDKSYRVLVGPYPKKQDALTIQENLPDYTKKTMLIALEKNSYDNFEYRYRFNLVRVLEKDYNQFKSKALAAGANQLPPEKTNNYELAQTKEKEILAKEKIKVTYDYNEAQKLLKSKLTFSGAEINELNCNGNLIKLPIPVSFSAYFPDENTLLTVGEGFNYSAFSTQSCKFTKRYPYFIRYAPDRKMRMNGNLLDPLGNDRFFVELWSEAKKQYIELIDIGIFFERHLDTQIEGIVWNGNNELFFIKANIGEDKKYYKIHIDNIKH